jgi:hypothetical protein
LFCDRLRTIFGFGAGFNGTAPIAQGLEIKRVHDIVTVVAPFSLLLAPRESAAAVPVPVFQWEVWPPPTVSENALPCATTTSTISSPAALATDVEALVLVAVADVNVPNGVVGSTSKNEAAPPTTAALAERVTMTLAVP